MILMHNFASKVNLAVFMVENYTLNNYIFGIQPETSRLLPNEIMLIKISSSSAQKLHILSEKNIMSRIQGD